MKADETESKEERLGHHKQERKGGRNNAVYGR